MARLVIAKRAHLFHICIFKWFACRQLSMYGTTTCLNEDTLVHPSFAALSGLTSLSAEIACSALHTFPSLLRLQQLYLTVINNANFEATALSLDSPHLTCLDITTHGGWALPVRDLFCYFPLLFMQILIVLQSASHYVSLQES